jgi:hypothetical protein
MNKKLPYDLTKEEIAELLKRKKEISDFVFEQFKSDPNMKTDYQKRYEELVEAVENFYDVKGRYNAQIAAAKLFELVGLPSQYPENYKLD